MSTTLVCVVNGSVYESFAEDLFRSAEEFFHPTQQVKFLMLQGPSGWPAATMYRHHILAQHMPNTGFVFLSDADMRFENHVGEEIVGSSAITATLHPGYVTSAVGLKPYENRPESAAYVRSHQEENYYCGGFIGGSRQRMLNLSREIANIIDIDRFNDITPVWHDESALNKVLAWKPPEIILSPSYCYPDNDAYYKTLWAQEYQRKLVALDKTQSERGER